MQENIEQTQECTAKLVRDRNNPNSFIFKCDNGLIVLPKQKLVDVLPDHNYDVKYVEKISRQGKKYGVLVDYHVIHDLLERSGGVIKSIKGDQLLIKEKTIRQCKKCNYKEEHESEEKHRISLITINGELYYVYDDGFIHFFLEKVDKTYKVENAKPEIEYIELEGDFNIPSIYIPNVVDKNVFDEIMQLQKEIDKINEQIRLINKYDVFVKEKNKYAKILEKEVKTPEKIYHVEIYKFDDGTEEVRLEYEAEAKVKVHSEQFYFSEETWSEITEKPETRKIIKQAKYNEIPLMDEWKKLVDEKKKIRQEQIKLLIDDLKNKGFKFNKNGNKVEIEYNGEKSELIIDEYNMYKGKYSLLGLMFAKIDEEK